MIEDKELAKLKLAVDMLGKQNRRLTAAFYILLISLVAVAGFSMAPRVGAGGQVISPDSVLRVRGLIVTDPNGKERVQIGAPLPNPLLMGKRYKRDGAVSGILMMDSDGNERSGYFTSDQPGSVALTLDTVAGQTAMFLANDERGANLQVYDSDFSHLVGLYAVGDEPNLVVERSGKTIFQLPEEKEEKK